MERALPVHPPPRTPLTWRLPQGQRLRHQAGVHLLHILHRTAHRTHGGRQPRLVLLPTPIGRWRRRPQPHRSHLRQCGSVQPRTTPPRPRHAPPTLRPRAAGGHAGAASPAAVRRRAFASSTPTPARRRSPLDPGPGATVPGRTPSTPAAGGVCVVRRLRSWGGGVGGGHAGHVHPRRGAGRRHAHHRATNQPHAPAAQARRLVRPGVPYCPRPPPSSSSVGCCAARRRPTSTLLQCAP